MPPELPQATLNLLEPRHLLQSDFATLMERFLSAIVTRQLEPYVATLGRTPRSPYGSLYSRKVQTRAGAAEQKDRSESSQLAIGENQCYCRAEALSSVFRLRCPVVCNGGLESLTLLNQAASIPSLVRIRPEEHENHDPGDRNVEPNGERQACDPAVHREPARQ
jgi:hypothetical protein